MRQKMNKLRGKLEKYEDIERTLDVLTYEGGGGELDIRIKRHVTELVRIRDISEEDFTKLL